MKTKPFLPFLLVCLLAFLCEKGLAAEPDSSLEKSGKQKFGFRFVARPLIGVADFGRSDFKRDIKTNLGISMPAYSGGVDAQFGLISSKRWGVGFNISFYFSGNNTKSKTYYRMFSINEGFYGEYAFIRKGEFELNGQLGLGIGQTFFKYENTKGVPDNISLGDYRSLGTVALRQKISGYASVGLSAKWLVSRTFAWGLHIKWLQQIGRGRWYASQSNVRINDLSKSSFVPLQIGIDMTFGSL